MTTAIRIRTSSPEDLPALEALYPTAFPEEDLLPLVRQLTDGRSQVISLIAVAGDQVLAHLALSECGLMDTAHQVWLLGPAAVTPGRQGEGIGDALVRDGIRRLRHAGFVRVQVLGDPHYYGRFGFEADDNVQPPYPLPDEWRNAWQCLLLDDTAAVMRGRLTVPEPWLPKELWLP